MEKGEFQFRELQILTALLEISDYQDSYPKNAIKYLLRVVHQNEKTLDWDHEARNQSGGYENYQLEYRKSVKTKSIFCQIRLIKNLTQGKKPKTFESKIALQKKLSIETLLEEIKPVLTE